MKKILLLSDTHGYMDSTIIKHVKLVDEVWHAGDIGDLSVTDTIKALKPLKAVYGNIDDDKARLEFPENNRVMCEKVDVWITHIGGYPGRYNMRVRDEIKTNPPKLFICVPIRHHHHHGKMPLANKVRRDTLEECLKERQPISVY